MIQNCGGNEVAAPGKIQRPNPNNHLSRGNLIHSFADSLKFSHEKEGELDKIYREYYGSVEYIARVHSMDRQHAGVDTIITLSSGEEIHTQEKWRTRKFTDDILIETCSVYRDGECEAPGWIYSLDADYMFTVYSDGVVKIYPCALLKKAWNENKQKWEKTCQRIVVHNDTYDTICRIVPCADLEREIGARMTTRYVTDGMELETELINAVRL